jgi:formylglycine-generating enzyme required for sulfatase activity
MSWLRHLAVALLLCCMMSAQAFADRRVALVIGNGAYAKAPYLPNPPHDAADVAAALERLGFEVIRGVDVGRAGMQDAVVRFARAAQSADVAIFYYSGHAMQFNGINYLIPVDGKLEDEADLYRFTRVDDVLGYLQQARGLKVLVLDSCRDNPLAESLKRSIGATRGASVGRGLARIEAPIGTIISYSTQAGRTALDGDGRNSPYTAAFLRHIEQRSEIGDIFRDISADVYRATGEKQLPELSLSIIGKFYLSGPVSVTVNVAPPPAAPDPCAAAADHWKSAEVIASLAAFEDHLARFSGCAFAGLARTRIDALKSKTAAVAPPVAPAVPAGAPAAAPAVLPRPATPPAPCGALAASPSSPRAAKPLTAAEECGLRPRDTFRECDSCPEMVTVPVGSFVMGARAEQIGNAAPPHQVTLARSFAAGRFHVTVAQFAAFVDATGYPAETCKTPVSEIPGRSWREPGFAQSGNHPVICVNWQDASAYVAWLAKRTGKPYRLLTEAEWEYAARGGTTTDWFWGDSAGKSRAHCLDCGGKPATSTMAVGSFEPNRFGLHDMAGNAQQWVQDCYQADYEWAPPDGSPRLGSCVFRVIRGGNWSLPVSWARSASRFMARPDERNHQIGFRVGRTLDR